MGQEKCACFEKNWPGKVIGSSLNPLLEEMSNQPETRSPMTPHKNFQQCTHSIPSQKVKIQTRLPRVAKSGLLPLGGGGELMNERASNSLPLPISL